MYSHDADYTLYKKFLSMTGNVKIGIDEVDVYLKKKETFLLCSLPWNSTKTCR
jgi:hypothetical protein